MHTKTYNILSVIPGTRYLGIAVFNSTDLREWSVKCLKEGSVTDKAANVEKVILRLIPQHKVDTIAIKKMHPSRCTQSLNHLISKIKEIGKRFKLRIIEYAVDKIKLLLLEHGKGNKKKIVEEVVKSYPCLYPDYYKEKKNKNRYFTRMFEAVALGIVAILQLEKPKNYS